MVFAPVFVDPGFLAILDFPYNTAQMEVLDGGGLANQAQEELKVYRMPACKQQVERKAKMKKILTGWLPLKPRIGARA